MNLDNEKLIEFAEEVSELLAANQNIAGEMLSPEQMLILIQLAEILNTKAVEEAVGTGNMSMLINTVPYFAPLNMFCIGILYGRKQAAEMLPNE